MLSNYNTSICTLKYIARRTVNNMKGSAASTIDQSFKTINLRFRSFVCSAHAHIGDVAGLSCAPLSNSRANLRAHVFSATRYKNNHTTQKLKTILGDMFVPSILAVGIAGLVAPKTLAAPSPVQLTLSRRLRNDRLVHKATSTLPKKNVPLKNYYDGTDLQ